MKTWAEFKSDIQKETNTGGEEFISPEEYLIWCNDAIDEAEKEIVGLHDKYLETYGTLSLVSGEDEIALPENIYANKITGIFYDGDEGVFEVYPIKKKEEIYNTCDQDRYKYKVFNNTDGRIIKIYPKSRETSAALEVYFIREAKTIAEDTDTIDIPIAEGFIKQYIKDKMLEKELGPGGMRWPSQALERERRLLIEALNNMIPDDNNELEVDMSFYEDFDDNWWGW